MAPSLEQHLEHLESQSGAPVRAVFDFLAKSAKPGAFYFVSRLAQSLGLKEPHVYKAAVALEAAGFLRREWLFHPPGGGARRSLSPEEFLESYDPESRVFIHPDDGTEFLDAGRLIRLQFVPRDRLFEEVEL